jgi:hypothetical protein
MNNCLTKALNKKRSAAIYWKQIKRSLLNPEQSLHYSQYGTKTCVCAVLFVISIALMHPLAVRKTDILKQTLICVRDVAYATVNAGLEPSAWFRRRANGQI